MIQRWLALVLNLIVSGVAIIVAVAAVELQSSIDPGFLGLALVNIVGGLSNSREHILALANTY